MTTHELHYVDPTKFGLNSPVQNKPFTKRSNKYNVIRPEGIRLLDGFELRQNEGSRGKIWMVDLSEKTTVYLASYTIKNLSTLGSNALTQIKVWRSAISTGVLSIPKEVFWQVLAAKADVLVSGKLRSVEGSKFWINRVGETLQGNGHAAFVWASDTKRLYALNNPSGFDAISNYLWDHRHPHIRLLLARNGRLDSKAKTTADFVKRQQQRQFEGKLQH